MVTGSTSERRHYDRKTSIRDVHLTVGDLVDHALELGFGNGEMKLFVPRELLQQSARSALDEVVQIFFPSWQIAPDKRASRQCFIS